MLLINLIIWILIMILIVDQIDQIRRSAMSRGGRHTASFRTNLYSNQLVHLPAGLFKTTTKLQYLILRKNKLVHLPAGLFDATTELKVLELNNNQLVHLPDGLFKATTKLQTLHLQSNNLRYLPGGLPHDTPQLSELLLNNGVSHNLRLCALKFPTDFSNGYILYSGGVKDYIASSLNETICRQNCSIISDLDKCDLCTGYLYNYTCIERDECLHQIHNCDSNASCTNTVRSYNCTCNSGFSGDGRSCVCNCLNHGQCTEDGTCNCRKGFHGDKCQHNIDECLPASPCHVDAICIDNDGGYMCLCKSGYHGNGTQCQDQDECIDQTHICSSNATCNNSIGSYQCTCRSGYTGDGTSCTVMGTDSRKAGKSGAKMHLPCLGIQAALIVLLTVVLPFTHMLG
ncbi:fibrillin-1-like [Sycon ciliatum]|uniref:fibrillin-1-like n=1 Tax=Sycon ciliatum TaxID=27933 RepID=UPI0031F68F60